MGPREGPNGVTIAQGEAELILRPGTMSVAGFEVCLRWANDDLSALIVRVIDVLASSEVERLASDEIGPDGNPDVD